MVNYMANWALLQEQLTGKPVVKRAKHGIHFDNGDGQVLAHFSGKPCHYEDAGLWKPIDTRLLVTPDGFYGCPHSKVKVHPDGRVAVAGTDYAQRAELPSAKTGLADGDKLIREFSFGKQEMRITEDGFRSEITLNRIPTLTEARKLIASESGTLSKKYLKSLTTATDANGDSHTFSTLSAFRTWLAKAVFPVVIDPDFSGISNADAYINKNSADSNYSTGVNRIGVASVGSTHYRGLYQWDVSSIDAGVTVSASSITIYCSSATDNTKTSYVKVYRLLRSWVEAQVTWNSYSSGNSWGEAGAFGSTDCEQAEIGSFDALDVGSYQFSITASKVQEWISGSLANNGLLMKDQESLSNSYKRYDSKESATESYRPVLSVTYSAAGGFHPINMNAQMQSLSGNMRG
jgi:hypothetical protein